MNELQSTTTTKKKKWNVMNLIKKKLFIDREFLIIHEIIYGSSTDSIISISTISILQIFLCRGDKLSKTTSLRDD